MERKVKSVLLFIAASFVISKARLTEKSPERVTSITTSVPVKTHNYRFTRQEGKGWGFNQISPIRQRRVSLIKVRVAKKIFARSISDSEAPESKVLVKAPIPKYFELHEDEVEALTEKRNYRRVVDSGPDHEDEDFNIDDYDFDVKHDEFVGRYKPKEPKVIELIVSEPTVTKPPAAVISNKAAVKEFVITTYKPNLESD